MADDMFRVEPDLLGDQAVPDCACFAIHTLRAVHNLPINGIRLAAHPDLLHGLESVKQVAAVTNRDLRLPDPSKAGAVIAARRGDPLRQAARPVRGGRHPVSGSRCPRPTRSTACSSR